MTEPMRQLREAAQAVLDAWVDDESGMETFDPALIDQLADALQAVPEAGSPCHHDAKWIEDYTRWAVEMDRRNRGDAIPAEPLDVRGLGIAEAELRDWWDDLTSEEQWEAFRIEKDNSDKQAELDATESLHIGCRFNHEHRWPDCYDEAYEPLDVGLARDEGDA